MSEIVYIVTATFPDEGTATEYIDWLKGGHVKEVVAGGAASGAVVRILEPAEVIRVECHYRFLSRAAYERYVTEAAPALRAEGVRRFGGRSGVTLERRLGVVV